MTTARTPETSHVVNTAHIGPAYRAYWAGDSSLLGDLLVEFLPLLRAIAERVAITDREEAIAVMSEAMLTVPRGMDPDAPGAIGYVLSHVRSALVASTYEGNVVRVPHAMATEYFALRDRFTEAGDQAQEWVHRAYAACQSRTSGQSRLSASTFLALYKTLSVPTNNIVVGTDAGGEHTDENGHNSDVRDLPTALDEFSVCDDRALVREGLLPILDEEERLIIILTYGFIDLVPPALLDVLVAKGVDITDGRQLPLSSRVVAEVLGVNGYGLAKMGRMTVQRRHNAALDRMRAYLDEDSRRESL